MLPYRRALLRFGASKGCAASARARWWIPWAAGVVELRGDLGAQTGVKVRYASGIGLSGFGGSPGMQWSRMAAA
ncbi:hypothetical protein [Streptomyces sp. NPDC002346]